METAPHRPTAEEIAELVVHRLVEGGGIPDLANANLMTIEEQTIKEVDRVTQIVMSELLSQQSQEADPAIGEGATHNSLDKGPGGLR